MHISDAPLDALEQQLRTMGVDVYIQPMVDAFQSEYTPDSARRLPYLTGFDGSAGLGVFFAQASAENPHLLLTDGRYTLQAAQQLGARVRGVNSGEHPLASVLMQLRDVTIGFDPWLITRSQLLKWLEITDGHGVQWLPLAVNPVDAIWADRPAEPAGEVVLHPMVYAGQSYEEKRAALLQLMAEAGADALILTLPDGINWLLNIRGSDVAFNPLLLCYFILRSDASATLFLHERPLNESVGNYLAEQGVAVAPLQAVMPVSASSTVAGSAALIPSPGCRVLIDPSVSAQGWWQLAEAQQWQVLEIDDPTMLPKACKNGAEIAGIRQAHGRDGLALTRFLAWLEGEVTAKKFPTELAIVDRLEQFRAAAPEYRGASFATIAGSGAHGAIVHYRADAASNRQLRPGELFLLDSGGQYADGTTDVTRTIAIGTPTTAMCEHYTRVLKGHIALADARFPPGTSGQQLDVLARQYLWAAGLDFDHGTGHGVGAYLSVHEGPQRISKRGSSVALQPGMVVSNEPGYYAAGAYGIRIESLVTVVPLPSGMLGFETLTLAPIDVRLIHLPLMRSDERNWLNSYHRRVYDAHAPHLSPADAAWLAQATRAV